jgi:hypothetical protein
MPECLAGRYNLCPDVRFFATPPYDGAFSQFVAMPAAFVYPVPDTISDDAARLLEPLSVGVRTMAARVWRWWTSPRSPAHCRLVSRCQAVSFRPTKLVLIRC